MIQGDRERGRRLTSPDGAKKFSEVCFRHLV